MTSKLRNLRGVALSLAMLALVAACNRNDPSSFIASAKTYVQKSDYKAAIVQLKNAIEGAPGNGEARYLLANALLQSGDAGGAETEARKAIELKYLPEQTYPLLARALVAEGKSRAAIDEVGAIKLETTQGRADVGVSIAIAHSQLGNAKAAVAAIDAVLAEMPGDARALVVKAQIMAQANQPQEAMDLVDAALATSPDNREALVAKAQLLITRGKRNEAIALLEKMIEKHPDTRGERVPLISLLVASSRLDDAERQLEKLKALAPNEIGTVYADALVTLARGNATHARDLIQRVLAVQPENLPALYVSGLADLQLKSYAGAEASFRKIVTKAPDDGGVRRMLALTYLRSGQPALALEAVEPALRRTPDDTDVLKTAAEAALATGNAAKAAQYFERANVLDKNDVGGRVRLAQVRLATGDTERALQDLRTLAQSDSSQYQADMALILAYIQRKEYDRAIAAVDALEKKQPDNPVTRNMRGAVYMAKRDFKGARESYQKALDAQPKDFASAYSLAILDIQEGKADDARRRFEQMLTKDPNNESLLLALSDLTAMTRDKPEEAKALIDKAIAANPGSARAALALVAYFTRQRDSRAALAAAQAAQTTFPNDPGVLDALARAQGAAGDANQALATYGGLARLQPQNPSIQLQFAMMQLQAKDYSGATESARRALAAQPELLQAWGVLARAQAFAGQSATTLAEARRMQRDNPDKALGFALEGEFLAIQNKWADAATVLTQGLAKQPIPLLAAANYSALQNAGKPAEAAAFADKWIRAHPNDATLQEVMAQQLQFAKNYPAAAAKYRAVLDINPENPVALNNLAWILAESGDPKAREIAERAYRLAPDSPSVIDTLGWTLVRGGDVTRGTQLLRLASNLAPGENEIRMHLGRALVKSGDKEGARRALEPFTKLDAGAPLRADAEKALAGN
jgi:putative PEP-CTERM system TPR-repeat lipoprotein